MHPLLGLLLVSLAACALEDTAADAARVEGRTPAVADGASLYALRLWTAPELDSLHRAGVRVDSLEIEPTELRLRAGQSLPLARLSIVALDSLGRTIPGAPVVLETGSDLLGLTPTLVVARSPGRATLRVRCLLHSVSGASEERTIPVLIH